MRFPSAPNPLRVLRRTFPIVPLLGLAFSLTLDASAGGLGKSLLDLTDIEDDSGDSPPAKAPGALGPAGLPSAGPGTLGPSKLPSFPPAAPPAAPEPPKPDPKAAENELRLKQFGVLEERARKAQEELTQLSSPGPAEELARVEDQIRRIEATMADRKARLEADIQRLGETDQPTPAAQEAARKKAFELTQTVAKKQEESAAELAPLRARAAKLREEDAARPRLDPPERFLRQLDLNRQITELFDLMARIRDGEVLPFDPAAPPEVLPGMDAAPPLGDTSGASPQDLRERAVSLRQQAARLVDDDTIESELIDAKQKLKEQGVTDPGELEEALRPEREKVEARNQKRADQLIDEARGLEGQAYLNEFEDEPPLKPGARFQLTISAAAHVESVPPGGDQQVPIVADYKPARVTWTMKAIEWPDMAKLLTGPDGASVLTSEAKRAIDAMSSDAAANPDRLSYYRTAVDLLAAMREVGSGSVKLIRDTDAPPAAEFGGTSLVEWSKVEPSTEKDVPPTLIKARLQAPPFSVADSGGAWPESHTSGEIVLVQTTPKANREVERLGNELDSITFDTNDADRKFIERLGALHDRMRRTIGSVSSSTSRAATSIGLSGGMYELRIPPTPFNWMPLQWNATVTKTGGGRAAPETKSQTAKGSAYPIQTDSEIGLGKLGIGELIANVKPMYLLVSEGQLATGDNPEKLFQDRVHVVELSHGSRARRESLQAHEGIELLGEWRGSAYGKVVFASSGSSGESRWNHEYTFTWDLQPI